MSMYENIFLMFLKLKFGGSRKLCGNESFASS